MTDLRTLRAWWAHRQGLDGSLRGAEPAAALARSGWARSVGGSAPYLTLFARTGATCAAIDDAVADLEIHELPAARGCTYVVPANDFAAALTLAEDHAGSEMRQAMKLGVTEREIDRLCDAIQRALDGATLTPDELRAETGDLWRSLGDEGRKKGLSTTLPLALERLQVAGTIRRVPVNGRLDQQRYAYTGWSPGPRETSPTTLDDAYRALALAWFRWTGPGTLGELQWFTGMGVKATKAMTAGLPLVPAWPGSDRLILDEDVEAFKTFVVARDPHYALVSSLDAISHLRRDVSLLLDEHHRDVQVVRDAKPVAAGTLSELPSHAILDRGELIGLWEFDQAEGTIAWATFDGRRDDPLLAAIEETQRVVRDQLGDARAFSLDAPPSRAPRIAALRALASR